LLKQKTVPGRRPQALTAAAGAIRQQTPAAGVEYAGSLSRYFVEADSQQSTLLCIRPGY